MLKSVNAWPQNIAYKEAGYRRLFSNQTSTLVHRDLDSCLLDSHRLGEVTGEVNVQALKDSKPVGNELERNDVEETLEAVNSLGDLNLLSLVGLELLVARVANDNGLSAASNDYRGGVSILL